MKKIILSLTVLMSIVGTGTSFGKSINHNEKNSPKQEMVVNQKSDKHCNCKTCKDLLKKHKVQKKNQCTCKNCQKLNKNHKVQKKNQCTCKNCQKLNKQTKQHFQTQKNVKVQSHHK